VITSTVYDKSNVKIGDYFSAFQNATKFSVGPSANKLPGTVRRNLDGNLRREEKLKPSIR